MSIYARRRFMLHMQGMKKSLPEDCDEREALDATMDFVNGCVVKVNETQADFESTTALLNHLKQFNAEVCVAHDHPPELHDPYRYLRHTVLQSTHVARDW